MAGRIQGITVEIGGDTTKLQTALKGVNTEIRNTQSQLRDVDKLLKLEPGNTELLAQKHRVLGDAVKETKEKLKQKKMCDTTHLFLCSAIHLIKFSEFFAINSFDLFFCYSKSPVIITSAGGINSCIASVKQKILKRHN